MAELDIVNASKEIVLELGKVGLWVQAIGLIIVLWVVFEVVALIVNRKKRKAIYKIKDDLQRIEKKVDKILDKI